MQLFVSQFLVGIGNGVVYASVALALVLIFRATNILNFAQGEMALFSTYISWKLSADMHIALAIVISMAIALVGGAVIERVLIRPVEEARSPLNVVIVTLGMFLAINSLAQLSFGTDPEQMDSPFPGSKRIELIGSGSDAISMRPDTLGLIVVLIGECALLWFLLQRTRIGLNLRAVASNPESARLVGINTRAMLMLGWGLAATIGALAGSLVAAERGHVDASLMQSVLVFAFAAAALGGFESLLGAVVAGLVVGVARSLTIEYVDFLDGIEVVLPLALILAVLLVKPAGLFGRRTVERV